MRTRTITVPEEILALLEGSRLAGRAEEDRGKIALATHLFREGLVSLGRAAELAGESRVIFESLLVELVFLRLRTAPKTSSKMLARWVNFGIVHRRGEGRFRRRAADSPLLD